MIKKRFLFILLFTFGLLFLLNNCSYGAVDNSYFDEENHLCIDYTCFSPNDTYSGSIVIPDGVRSYNYIVCVDVYGLPYIFTSGSTAYPNVLIVPYNKTTNQVKILFCSEDFSKVSPYTYYHRYNLDTNTWNSLNSNHYYSTACTTTPSCFIYSFNSSVYYTNYNNTVTSSNSIILTYAYSYSQGGQAEYGFYMKNPLALSYPLYNTEFYDFSDNGLIFNLHGNYIDAELQSDDLDILSSLSSYCLNVYSYSDYESKTYKTIVNFPYDVFNKYITYDDNTHSYMCTIPLSEFPDGFIVKDNYYYIDFTYKIKYRNTFIAPEGYQDYITTDTYYDAVSSFIYQKDFLFTGQTIVPPGDVSGGGNSSISDGEKIINDTLEKLLSAIGGQSETSGNIFEMVGKIFNSLNPFSKDFFGYKLVELIVDGIKSLFIPDDGFMEQFFNDLKEWFSDRLGFLFYPFELIIDILNKLLNIDFGDPIFNIPDINEPFTNTKLISATTFNLNDMLLQDSFLTAHNIYLLCVDVFIIFGLSNLAKKKFDEVMGK